MGYRLREHTELEEFLASAGTLLYSDEAVHTVVLSMVARLAELPPHKRRQALLVSVDEAGEVVAAAVRTPPRALLLTAGVPPGAVDALAVHMDGRDESAVRINGLAADAAAVGEALASRRGAGVCTLMQLRLMACSEPQPRRRAAPGLMREAEVSDVDLLAVWLDAFTAESLPHERPSAPTADAVEDSLAAACRGIVVWEDGQPVSMAAYTRVEGGGSSRIGGVYTPPALRGRGYASALVGELTRRLLAGGQQVVLFTDRANPTSNRMYEAIGYRPVTDFAEIEVQEVSG